MTADGPVGAALERAVRAAALGEVETHEKDGGVAVLLWPRAAHDVARAVSIAARLGAKVAVTRRLRPGLLALQMHRLDAVEAPDEANCLVRVGAGALVRQVEARAIQSGLTLGPLLPSTARKRVGAWLSGPTRGERSIPGDRLETAALALEAVLAEASFYRSRETPRSATGPDLDHLLLGGEGRFGLITRATLRLFPRALAEATASRRVTGLVEAVAAVREASLEGLSPAEARWERALGTVEARFTGMFSAPRARRFGAGGIAGHEMARADLELCGSWRAWNAATPLRPEAFHLVGIHLDGAFGALRFEDPSELERAAHHAQAIGFAVVSPRCLRAPVGAGLQAAGAAALHEALLGALDPKSVFERMK